jgi:hypothetical protein
LSYRRVRADVRRPARPARAERVVGRRGGGDAALERLCLELKRRHP